MRPISKTAIDTGQVQECGKHKTRTAVTATEDSHRMWRLFGTVLVLSNTISILLAAAATAVFIILFLVELIVVKSTLKI